MHRQICESAAFFARSLCIKQEKPRLSAAAAIMHAIFAAVIF